MSQQKKDIVLYFYTAESPFVAKDIEIINTEFEVKKFFFNIYNKKKLFAILFQQFFFLFKNSFSAKLIVCQFAGMHSFLPVLMAKLFFKKSVIVSGGTDCVSFPSINYGNFLNKKTRYFTRFSFKNAALILPVHESLILYDYTYQKNDFPKQGIKYFIPEIKTKFITIYNGYDSGYWHNTLAVKEAASFITVLGHVNSRFTIELKGIDLFIGLCNKFPNATFIIVGGEKIDLKEKPTNLNLLPNIWGDNLIDLFSSKQFYVQLSVSEGFPNALCEAMLCECVPIVSAVGAMPDIVQDNGYILKEKNEIVLESLVTTALNEPQINLKGKQARQKIQSNYTFNLRKEKVVSALRNLV